MRKKMRLVVAVALLLFALPGCDLFLSEDGRADEVVRGSSILYFADDVMGVDQVLAGLQVLDAQGIVELAVAVTREDAIAGMAADPAPDVVIYFNQDQYLSTADEDALIAWIAGGGRLIYADWTWNARVLPEVEVADAGTENETPVTFTDERLTVGVTDPLPLANTDWGTWSMGLQPVDDAVSLGSFPSGSSCLVAGNGGRTLTVGFLSDTVQPADGRNFIRNLVRVMIE